MVVAPPDTRLRADGDPQSGAALAGRVAIVTGAARGLGHAIARSFVREGAAVAMIDRDPAVDSAASDIARESQGTAQGLVADVSNEAEVEAAVQAVHSRFGRIDVLVNNAGVAPSVPFAELTLARWREVIDTDLTSAFLCCSAVVPVMLAAGSGRIINIGSQLGFAGRAEMVHYSAAKAGVHGFTKALARELAPYGVTVNAVAPGPVETPGLAHAAADVLERVRSEVPLGRFAAAEEIVPAVLLLASDAGTYFCGSIINVSGGHVM